LEHATRDDSEVAYFSAQRLDMCTAISHNVVRKAYGIRPLGYIGNLSINLPNLAMVHPYEKGITKTCVYGTFTHPMVVTTVKLQRNHKRFAAIHTTFPSCRVSLKL